MTVPFGRGAARSACLARGALRSSLAIWRAQEGPVRPPWARQPDLPAPRPALTRRAHAGADRRRHSSAPSTTRRFGLASPTTMPSSQIVRVLFGRRAPRSASAGREWTETGERDLLSDEQYYGVTIRAIDERSAVLPAGARQDRRARPMEGGVVPPALAGMRASCGGHAWPGTPILPRARRSDRTAAPTKRAAATTSAANRSLGCRSHSRGARHGSGRRASRSCCQAMEGGVVPPALVGVQRAAEGKPGRASRSRRAPAGANRTARLPERTGLASRRPRDDFVQPRIVCLDDRTQIRLGAGEPLFEHLD